MESYNELSGIRHIQVRHLDVYLYSIQVLTTSGGIDTGHECPTRHCKPVRMNQSACVYHFDSGNRI